MINKLKLFYPHLDAEIIEAVVELVEGEARNYCNLLTLPAETEPITFAMAQETINKLGSEGYASESIAGNSVNYSLQYSEKIYQQLNKFKRVRVIGV